MSKLSKRLSKYSDNEYIYTQNTSIAGKLIRVQAVVDGVLREAERWIKCERITPTGAIFSREFEPRIRLTDAQIEREVYEQ